MKSFKNLENQKTAIIYTRVSTDEQAEHGFSLPHQEDLLRKECARQGITVLDHFQDDGYSAKDFNRPGFKRLLDYLSRHKKQVAYLFVTKWCRFSRDVANSIIMRRELNQYGVQVKALTFMGNSDDPEGLLLEMIHMTLPEIDNRIRARNTKAGIYRALKEGYYPYGCPPKGYKKDRISTKTPLLIPNEEAELVKEAFELFATDAFPIEDIRSASWKNGLRLKRTQFGQLLRNPIYVGKILVPETKDEPKHFVAGKHQPLVSEETFFRVQSILKARDNQKAYIRQKEKLREEFPLRGHLKCPKCMQLWTGSISNGNGGKYAYYHCSNPCKVRVRADEANGIFFDYLHSIQVPSEIKDLHLAMMEKLFEAREGSREEQLVKLNKEIEQHEDNLLKFDRKMYVEETMEGDSYKRLKKQALDAMEQAKRQTQELVSMDTAFEKYCRFGMCILTNLDYYFEEASLEVKRKMLGSIFPGKLTFEDGKYRTDGLNPALAIILQKSNRLQNEKTGNIVISENVSGDVQMTGLEPALCCQK